MSEQDGKFYLGDGVHVSMSWGDITLETDRAGVRHWIVLGPAEYDALLAYVDRAVARGKAKAEGREP